MNRTEFRVIPLTQGKETIVDVDIFDSFGWIGWRHDGVGYAVRKISDRAKHLFPLRSRMFLHNLIMRPGEGFVVDHINGNGLDNRRSNLRICTPIQNSKNRRPTKNRIGASIYKGVYRLSENSWRSVISHDHKRHDLGCFKTELEAAVAYDDAAKRLHGEYAKVNDV